MMNNRISSRTTAASVCVSLALFASGAAAAGTFSVAPITGDADSGISAAKTYAHAVDFGAAGAGSVVPGGVDPGTTITTYHLDAANNPDGFHQYGFTNEVVPEPGFLAVAGLGCTALLRRRRGRCNRAGTDGGVEDAPSTRPAAKWGKARGGVFGSSAA